MYCVIFNNVGETITTTFDTTAEALCYIEGMILDLNGIDVKLDDFVVVKGNVIELRPARNSLRARAVEFV